MNKKHRIYVSLLFFITVLLFSECLSVGAFYQEAAEPPYSGVNETDWAALQAIYNKMMPSWASKFRLGYRRKSL